MADERVDNRLQGVMSGSMLQAGNVRADTINLGVAGGHGRPGVGSADVPWARLAEQVRGRDALVRELAGRVRSGAGVVVLHGGGGRGKTTIALSVANVVPAVRVWWVDASTASSIEAGLREVAIQAGADPALVKDAWGGEGSAAGVLWRALNDVSGRWLLVVDNADDVRILAGSDGLVDGRGWLSTPPSAGTVMITTRDAGALWPAGVHRYAVDALSDEDGAAMLLDLVPGDREAAIELARRLGGLPLALRLAGLYLKRAGGLPALPGLQVPRTFAEYGQAWEDRFVGERELLGKTWELSLDLLTDRGVAWARPVLRLVSFLASAPVPWVLLDASVMTEYPLFTGITPEGLAETVQSLLELGLLDPADDGVAIHPVVRDSCRWQADAVDNAEQYRLICLGLLERATCHLDCADPRRWPAWRKIWPHVAQMLDDPLLVVGVDDHLDELVAPVARRTADFGSEVELGTDAERWYRMAMEIWTRLHGAESAHTLTTRHNLALVLADRGDLATAEKELRDILTTRTRILGAEYRSTLATRHNLALILADRGDLATAEKELRDILSTKTRNLGNEHPDTLTTRHELARVLSLRGLATAETEFRNVLTIETRVRGAEHPSTLTTRHNLALVCRDRGDLATAENELRDTLIIRTRVMGAEHPDTLTTRHNLALICRDRGDLATAENELRDILLICEAKLDHRHSLTADVRKALEECLRRSGG